MAMLPATKVIEKKWHAAGPILHNGLEICHEHQRNGIICFTAWNGDNPANDRQLHYSREQVAYCDVPDTEDLDWLTGKEDKADEKPSAGLHS